MKVVHRSSADETRMQRLGPYVIESFLDPDEERAGTVYRVRIEAGQTTSTSYHGRAEEYYFVLEGSGTLILDGEPRSVRRGDFVRLPPGTAHGFVTGDEPLELLNVHTPGCRPDRDTYFLDATPDGFAGR